MAVLRSVGMSQPSHAQPSASVTDEQRALSTRSADLCRSQPAVWSRAVRYADQLVADGLGVHDAMRHALEVLAPAPGD